MNIQYILLKPGTILLNKDYCWCKRLWYKIRNKKLPFNTATLFSDDVKLVNSHGAHTDAVVIEPKKAYSSKETRNLLLLVSDYGRINSEEASWLEIRPKNIHEMIGIVNIIRPGTFEKDFTLDSLLDNKYYNVRPLAKEKNWNEIVY